MHDEQSHCKCTHSSVSNSSQLLVLFPIPDAQQMKAVDFDMDMG